MIHNIVSWDCFVHPSLLSSPLHHCVYFCIVRDIHEKYSSRSSMKLDVEMEIEWRVRKSTREWINKNLMDEMDK